MDIRKVETMNFTKTAERQFTTQGNISKQILSLEKELNVKLFERVHRKIELTEVGNLLIPYVKNVVEQYHAMQEVLATYTQEKSLALHILTIPTMINYEGFTEITEFLKLYPEFTIQLKEVESIEMTDEELTNIVIPSILCGFLMNPQKILKDSLLKKIPLLLYYQKVIHSPTEKKLI